jgi:hypothetical protein
MSMIASTVGARVTEVPVRHHPRREGKSKYGLLRIFRVLADLITIKMIRSFRLRPLRLFGSLAGAAAVAGVLAAVASIVAITSFSPEKAMSLMFPGLTLLCFALAVYLLMLGLVGEVVIRDLGRGAKVLPLMRERER